MPLDHLSTDTPMSDLLIRQKAAQLQDPAPNAAIRLTD